MAVGYDNDTQSLNRIATATATFSHVISATASSPAILLYVPLTGITQTVSSASYAGTAAASIATINIAGNGGRIECWGLTNCAVGTNNVIVTLSGANADWDVSAISFVGVTAASAFTNAATTTDAAVSSTCAVTVTTSTGDMMSTGTVSISNNGTTSSPGTQRWLDNTGGTNTKGQSATGTGAVTLIETWDAAFQNGKAMIAVNILQDTGGGAPAGQPTMRRWGGVPYMGGNPTGRGGW